MARAFRFSALCAAIALLSVSTFAQTGPLTGTVIDIDEGRGRLQVESDADPARRITIETDAVSTTYHGFGGMIAGKPEIFVGSPGLANVRLADRIQVSGAARAESIYKADRITLLGRAVAAGSVGVGQTRDPSTSAATPLDARTTRETRESDTVEGTIRQINSRDGRLVIQANRRMITVRAGRNTPVIYRGETYRTSNLEVGDVIRVDIDPRTAAGDDVTAQRIVVIRGVQDNPDSPGTGGLVTTLEGLVNRVEPGLDYAYLETERGEVRIDMSQAEDARGDLIRARDLRAGDRVEISGSYNRTGDIFLASTVRLAGDRPDEPGGIEDVIAYGLVTITGTIVETLDDAATVGVRDGNANRVMRLWIAGDFAVRLRGGTYIEAEDLRVNDTVVVDAFRDAGGNLIAQVVRVRNR